VGRVVGMAAKEPGTTLREEDVPPVPAEHKGLLSGADIEGIVARAWRRSLLSGAKVVTPESLADVMAQFLPSTQGLEKELQEVAAIIECTDREFLPRAIADQVQQAGGRGPLQQRLTRLKEMVAQL